MGAPDAPLLAYLKRFALAIASAQVSRSALDARQLGFLKESDTIVMNRQELVYVAVRQAQALASAGTFCPTSATVGRIRSKALSSLFAE